jgi:hypothetical protein
VVEVCRPTELKDFNDVLCADPAARAERDKRKELRDIAQAEADRQRFAAHQHTIKNHAHEPFIAPGYLGNRKGEGHE